MPLLLCPRMVLMNGWPPQASYPLGRSFSNSTWRYDHIFVLLTRHVHIQEAQYVLSIEMNHLQQTASNRSLQKFKKTKSEIHSLTVLTFLCFLEIEYYPSFPWTQHNLRSSCYDKSLSVPFLLKKTN